MKKIGITEETIQYIIDSIYNEIVKNDKIPKPDVNQIKLDYGQLSDLVLSRIPKPEDGKDYILTDKDREIISGIIKKELPSSDKLKKDIVLELESMKSRFDSNDIDKIISKVQSKIKLPEQKLDSTEIIKGLLDNIIISEDQKRIDFYKDEIFSQEIKGALSKQVLDQIEPPKDGEKGTQGEKGEPGKDAQPLPLTEKDKKEIADFIDVTKLIKDRKQDIIALVKRLKSGEIKLPSHAGIDVKEIINEISKILGTPDWKNGLPGDGSSPGNLENLQLTTGLENPAHSEGLLFYDDTKKAVSYYNEESDVTVNLGQELLIPVRNETGDTITNGTPVYPAGISNGDILIGLANAKEFRKSRLVGIVTHSIEDNTDGYVTKVGEVGGLDTSMFSEGDLLFLSTTDGELTNVQPTGESFITQMAAIKIKDSENGSIVVDVNTSELAVEVTDTNGFTSDQRSATTITFSDSTSIFEIAPTGSDFHFYQNGIKYRKEASENITLSTSEGLNVIYYDLGVLTAVHNPTASQQDVVIRTKCIVAYVYWDSTNSEHNYFADERHGISMDPETHSYLHFTRGAQYLSGLGIGDLIVDGNGNTNSHAQFSAESGIIVDEDLPTFFSTITSTTGLPIYYLDGASANMRRVLNSGFSVLDDVSAGVGSTGRIVWNEFTGGAWQLTTATNNDFVLCHVFAVNGVSGEDQQIAVIGQNEYGNATTARAGASTEISNIVTQFPFEEIVPIGTVIFQTGSVYLNDVKARVRPATEGDYVDWRTTELAQGTAATAHGNLTGLSNDDHLQYLLLAGRSGQTIDFATYPTLISGYKSGTLASPPASLVVGERWADTTDSATHPIIRISTTTT